MYGEELHKGAGPYLFKYARENRGLMTDAEKVLWNYIRGRKLKGHKFRRQHPIDTFVADFYCAECSLVVEVDGDYHDDVGQKQYDAGRTYLLEGLNIKVIRFTNKQILENLDFVLKTISENLTNNNNL